jgi:DnaD/phage-associated family protein
MYQTFYEAFSRPASSMQIQKIDSYIDQDGMDPELITLAIEKAGQAGANFNYVVGILNNWISKKVLTLTDAESEQKQFQANRQQRGKVSPFPVKTVPDYLKSDTSKVNINTQEEEKNAKWLDELLKGNKSGESAK